MGRFDSCAPPLRRAPSAGDAPFGEVLLLARMDDTATTNRGGEFLYDGDATTPSRSSEHPSPPSERAHGWATHESPLRSAARGVCIGDMRRAHALLPSLVLALACGDDDAGAPGSELAPCLQGQFCTSPLQCVDDLCVHPDQLDDTGGAGSISTTAATSVTDSTTNPGSTAGDGTATSGAATGADTGGSPEIHCTTDTSVGCYCSHNADYGPTGVACSAAVLPPPASCCANEGWPSYGGCSCWTYSCRMIAHDICYCGPGQPDGMDTPVESCTPPVNGAGSGSGVCCNDPGLGTCSCYADLTACLEGELQVSGCSTGSILCNEGSSAVSACN